MRDVLSGGASPEAVGDLVRRLRELHAAADSAEALELGADSVMEGGRLLDLRGLVGLPPNPSLLDIARVTGLNHAMRSRLGV